MLFKCAVDIVASGVVCGGDAALYEAIAVLRRAEPLLEAVEKSKIWPDTGDFHQAGVNEIELAARHYIREANGGKRNTA